MNDLNKNYFRYKGLFLDITKIYNTKPDLKIYLELILSISTIAIFSVFAIKPTILTIIDLNKEITQKEETVSKLEEKITNLQSANTILQKEAERLILVDQAVPNVADPEQLIKQIEYLASIKNVQLLNFSTSDVTLIGKNETKKKVSELENLPDNADEIPFNISASGSYKNLIEYLKILEFQRRPIKVDSVAFNTSTTDSGKILTMTLTGRVPYLYKNE